MTDEETIGLRTQVMETVTLMFAASHVPSRDELAEYVEFWDDYLTGGKAAVCVDAPVVSPPVATVHRLGVVT